MNALGPILGSLPPVVKIVFAVVLLTLMGIYYIFQAIRAFPWKRSPEEAAPPVKPATRQHSPRKRRRRQRQ